tara:strand:- start:32 stop:232 length:201 start_codon:yes stop_codon:yes gene_type:complete
MGNEETSFFTKLKKTKWAALFLLIAFIWSFTEQLITGGEWGYSFIFLGILGCLVGGVYMNHKKYWV